MANVQKLLRLENQNELVNRVKEEDPYKLMDGVNKLLDDVKFIEELKINEQLRDNLLRVVDLASVLNILNKTPVQESSSLTSLSFKQRTTAPLLDSKFTQRLTELYSHYGWQ